jgi:hypothetical protein
MKIVIILALLTLAGLIAVLPWIYPSVPNSRERELRRRPARNRGHRNAVNN